MLVVVVAAVAIVAETLTALAFMRYQRSVIREGARERDRLINQLCNLAGKPWLPAPADEWEPELEDEPVLVAAPEQLDW